MSPCCRVATTVRDSPLSGAPASDATPVRGRSVSGTLPWPDIRLRRRTRLRVAAVATRSGRATPLSSGLRTRYEPYSPALKIVTRMTPRASCAAALRRLPRSCRSRSIMVSRSRLGRTSSAEASTELGEEGEERGIPAPPSRAPPDALEATALSDRNEGETQMHLPRVPSCWTTVSIPWDDLPAPPAPFAHR
jgi:hypothetical protein